MGRATDWQAVEDDTEVRSQEEIQRIFNDADDDGNGNLSFEEVRQAILQHMLFEVQPGRYYVVVSLAEAETLRALLHGRSGQLLIAGSGASIALRHIGTPWNSKPGSLIEKSANFELDQKSDYQNTTARQCLRLFDSELDFTPRDINVVLRGKTAQGF